MSDQDNSSDKSDVGNNQPTPKNIPNSPKPIMWFNPESMPTIPAAGTEYLDNETKPELSIVIMVYKMPEQAKNTIYSLSAFYQEDVREEDYEIIVMENPSDNMLGKEAAERIASNVRYFFYEETLPTPVNAMNYGAEVARGDWIGVMIDGARMVTPGMINYILAARRLGPNVVISVPGYHLGHKVQQEAMLEGYDEEVERQLLESIDWTRNGYRLFEISCLSGTSAGGYFKPIGECNCFGMPQHIWEKLGGYDPGFTETGGGQCNLDLYKRAVELEETTLVTLLGEGSFHQFHGGITTGTKGEERLKAMQDHFNQYTELRGEPYKPPLKRSIYLGTLPDCALKFVRHSASVVMKNHGWIPRELK